MINNYPLISYKQQELTGDKISSFKEVLNYSGLYCALRQNEGYQKLQDCIIDILVGIYQQRDNSNFQKNLNWLEKSGFVSESKLQNHYARLGYNSVLYSAVLRELFNAVPIIIDYVTHLRDIQNLKKFIIGWLIYINDLNTVSMENPVSLFFRKHMKTKFDRNEYLKLCHNFESSREKPNLPGTARHLSYSIYCFILTASDLSDKCVYKRAMELGEYLGLTLTENEDLIKQGQDNLDLVSDFTRFTAISMNQLFEDMVKDINHCRQYANYCADNDPYNQKRKETKQYLLGVVKDVSVEAVELIPGPMRKVARVFVVSAINPLINPENSFHKYHLINEKIHKEVEIL